MTIRSRRTLGTFFSAREVLQLPGIRISSSYRKCGLEQEQIFGQAEAVPSYGFCSQHSETFLHIRVYPCSLDHGLLSNSLQLCEENRRSQFPKAEQLPAQKHRRDFHSSLLTGCLLFLFKGLHTWTLISYNSIYPMIIQFQRVLRHVLPPAEDPDDHQNPEGKCWLWI